MRISDWSSDVCSSDLTVLNFRRLRDEGRLTLYPQPIMDIRGPEPRLAKAELLMRMRMRDGYQSLPQDTVATLEYFGMTPDLAAFYADRTSLELGKSVSVRCKFGGRAILEKNTRKN